MTYLLPVFPDNQVSIVLCCDETYAKFASVTIQSIISNASEKSSYDIVIMGREISDVIKDKILGQANDYENISIRFFDMRDVLKNIDTSLFFVDQWISIETYYRFFIPRIFSAYKKALYIDSDMVVNCDINELCQLSLDGFSLAATQEPAVEYFIGKDSQESAYYLGQLKLARPQDYFQAGLLLMNIPKMNTEAAEEKLLSKLKELHPPRHHDQDVLNAVYQGDVKYLDLSWNCSWGFIRGGHKFHEHVSEETYFAYMRSLRHPKIIHYTSSTKPWHTKNMIFSDLFWLNARDTPFYKEIEEVHRNRVVGTVKAWGLPPIAFVQAKETDERIVYKLKVANRTLLTVKKGKK